MDAKKYLHKHLQVRETNGRGDLLDMVVVEVSKDGQIMRVTGDIVDLLVIEEFENNFSIVNVLEN